MYIVGTKELPGDKEMALKSVWALVEVRSGIPVSIRTFQDELKAKENEIELRKSLNLEKDETGVFRLKLEIE
jgi:hypothetical protein